MTYPQNFGCCLLLVILLTWSPAHAVNTPPTFSNVASDGSTRVTVSEQAAVDLTVFTLSANDADGDTLTYGLTVNPSDFKLSGQYIKVAAALDYETLKTYSLEVTVNDGTYTTTATITVEITNVNDETPTITAASYIASIAENQSPGTVVPFSLTISDTDAADTTLGEKLTYSLEGTDSSSFVINSLTGQITTALRLDRESKDTYDQLVFKVQDAASPTAHTATASLTVSVTDLNDVTPSCSPAVYYITVAENTAPSTSLTTLTCSDTDLSQNGYNTISYTIASGDPGNVFQLSASQLQTGATFVDYETHQLYTLVIHVADSPTSGSANTGTVTILVTVTGVNEYAPTWTAAPADISIAEDWAVGDTIFTITASDNDRGSDGTIGYSITNVVDDQSHVVAGIFRMDAVSGVLSTLQALDRDSGVTSYRITLKAEDKGSPSRSVTSSVTITITDVNDNDPVFTSSGYSKTLGESSATAGASLVVVSATDLDQSPVFTYSVGSVLVGNPAGTFEFDSSSAGLFKLATAIDLENHGYAYSLVRILVTDGGTPIRTGTATVTVSVFATNDFDPQFVTVPSGTVTVSEADPPGTLVTVVSATDQDIGSDGVVTLSITGGNTGNAFTILSNGEIRTLSTLDYEGGTISYNLVVTATDGGSTRRSASTTISIAISNANDNSPVCTSTLITATLPESATTTTVVASPSCSDADGNTLTYTLVSGNTDSKFAISSSSGQITLANTVDYDSGTKSYVLQVSVTDGTNVQTLTVNVNISPVNEATPTFTSSPTVTVSESEAAGYVVTTYTATDSDLAPHAITQYAITAVTQSGSSLFSIDRSSGTIRLLAPLDYDTLPVGSKQYVVTVTATDGGGLVGTGSVTVAVSDVNDNAPVCSQSSWSTTVLESVSTFPSVVINSLGCSDTEDGTSLTYTLNQSPGSMFSVVNGRIEQNAAVDYESSPLHVLSVVVADSGTPSLSTTVIVNIIVQNVNEGPPVFGGPYTATKAENVAIGTSVAQLVATDPDGATNPYGNPQYSILSGDPNGQFNIDSSTGLVTTRAALDAETTTSYILVVQALEKGGANSATATLTVTVTDVNDVTPSCTVSTFARTVSEAAATGSTILTLTCTDSDVTATTLTYSLASGDASLFAMTSNALSLSASLDYDAGTTKYDVTIQVSDGVHSAYVVGSVSVGAVNEFPPVFSQTTYTTSVSESFSVGGTVITVTATDGDSSSTADGVVTYGFVSSSSTFAIVSSSGAIVLSSALDRELVATYTLLVTAHDVATTVTATVSIIVNDVNDNPPVFASALYTAAVSETASSPATVVTVSASDADDPATNNNGVVVYSITAGNTNGHFTIGSSTGVITTTTQLNAASLSSYILTVTAKDRNGASGALSATCLVTVTVTAVNQYDPVFTSSTYSYTVAENTAVGTELVQVSATDADTGSGGVVTYSMTSHTKFLLSADGWISVKAALDHETTPTAYTFDVIAYDQGSPQRSATATVSITIGDVNDNTALCTLSVVSVQKREDYTGTITTLTCTDADAGSNAALTYTIHSVDGVAGGGAGSFSVSSAGVVSVSQLNYEVATSHEVVVVVADGGSPPRSTSVLVVVTVSDVNEFDPAFSSTPFSANIAENEALGATVLSVTASDNDGSDTVTYSLSSTTYLEVSALTGDITLKARLDYETTHSYSVDVCATDSNTVDARRSVCVAISITVTDANDNDPIFAPSVYVASVDENTSAGTTVVTVTATDRDVLAAGGTVSYAIASGNTGSVFRVDAAAGHVVIDDNTGLDYEAVRVFNLVVAASDGGGRSAQAVVTITVNPRNEATPTFSPASSTISIAENAAVGFSVATITATDADSGPDGQLTYSITAGASGKFAIESASGKVTLVASLDRETTQSYVLRIEAVDGGTTNPSAKTGTYSLTIDVTDVNDVTPACTNAYYSAAVPEDSAVGAAVTTLTCSDGDLDPSNLNNALTYTITGGNSAGHFAVGASGAVTVSAASLDRESTSSYILTIEVVDKATSGKLTTTVTVNVDITDVNDNPPVFTSSPYTLAVAENRPVGYTVGTVSATDQDAGSNAAITYSLVSASIAGKFAVDASTGVVTVAAALDYETTTSYTLVVSATDRGAVPLSATTTVSIAVSNVNDNGPICVASVYTATLPENADPATAVVVTVSCPDADTPVVTYSLTDTKFAVHPSTGVVSLLSALDCETAQAHTLTVTASDGTYTATTTVQVTVTDINEFDPAFAPTTPYTASVSEDSPAGYTVKDVDASDADVTNNVLTYSITSGNAAGKFTIDSATGVIQVLGSLDRETTSSYSLTLKVADGSGAGSRSSTTSIVITITDVNDNDPVCSPASYVASVNEDVAVSTTVAALTCSDADAGVTLAYTLLTSGNTGTAFAIGASSGEITVATALDYETLKAYALQVEVSDQSTPSARTTTVPVSVAVQPTNEFDPTFPASGYGNTDVSESTSVGTVILTVTATDGDVGLLQGTVRYSIISGNSLGHFAIDSASGGIKVAKALDRETTASYSLSIKAEDEFAGSPTLRSGVTTVGITILDVNDNYPVFNPTLYSVTVLETAPTGGTVATVTVSDDDAGTNAALTVTIVSGNTGNAFSISGSHVILAANLDYETTTSYELLLRAADQGTPTLTAQAMVVVTVGPVNEQAPLLTDTSVTLSISEATPIGTLIYTASASDSDTGGNNDGTVTYSIISGDTTPNSFYIGSTNGKVLVLSTLDYDTHPQAYTLTVEARDGGGLTSTAQLTITLLDENDNTPQFTRNTYTSTLNENVSLGTTVLTVTATDLDSGTNAQVSYSITGFNGPSSFTIDSTTGIITTSGNIDYESLHVRYLVVKAVDAGATPLSSTCLVRITIVDLNDNSPVVVPDDFTVTVAEDATIGTQVAAVAATDADSSANSNNVVVFGLSSTHFQVNPNTGDITTVAALDRETTPSFILLVTATDQGTDPHQNTVTSTVTVSLVDVNDNIPVISGTYDRTVSEDTAVNTIVVTVIATDADAGDNARLTYTITSGNTNSDFKMISSTGMLQIAKPLDRETTSLYHLKITVSDNSPTAARSSSTTVTLTISDVNDNDPIFSGLPYSFSVAENSNTGVTIGRLTATDADEGQNANLLFSFVTFWTGGSSYFSLNAAYGRITTAVSTLDRETQASYLVRCRVYDQGSPQRFADVNVSITITDVNDNPPVIAAGSYNVSVAENSAVMTSVLTISATDADIGVNADITYSIDTSTTRDFRASKYLQINGTSGEISVKSNIDYETDHSFVFVVVAADGGSPTFSDTTTVTVNVVDKNDNAPVFASTFINTEVAYAGQCSSAIATLTCTDADSGVNAQTLCYFSSNGYGSLFSIDGTACSVELSSIATSNTRYLLEVQCRDSGSPLQIAATHATVRVDTFIPDNVAIRFSLSISRSSFLAQQSTFLSNVQTLVRDQFPNAMVRLWCIEEREGTASSPSSTGRRRLLADQPVDVLVYATKDNTTNSNANTGQTKAFVSSAQLVSIFASDSTGTPSSAVSGSGWDYFGVEAVVEYAETSTPWIKTTEGIVVVTVCCVLALALLVLLIVLCLRCCNRRRRPVTPVRALIAEAKSQPVREKPVITGSEYDSGLTQPYFKKSVTHAEMSVDPVFVDTDRRPAGRRPTQDNLTPRPVPFASPRGVVLFSKNPTDVYPVVNRDFDGRALDPKTGRIYEYNTRTNERRWLEPPPPYQQN